MSNLVSFLKLNLIPEVLEVDLNDLDFHYWWDGTWNFNGLTGS